MLARNELPVYTTPVLTAIDLAGLSLGYPLLHLSRQCGVRYGEMLQAFERFAEGRNLEMGRWNLVLSQAFPVLLRYGIVFHPRHPPKERPVYPPAGTTVGEQVWQ